MHPGCASSFGRRFRDLRGRRLRSGGGNGGGGGGGSDSGDRPIPSSAATLEIDKRRLQLCYGGLAWVDGPARASLTRGLTRDYETRPLDLATRWNTRK